MFFILSITVIISILNSNSSVTNLPQECHCLKAYEENKINYADLSAAGSVLEIPVGRKLTFINWKLKLAIQPRVSDLSADAAE